MLNPFEVPRRAAKCCKGEEPLNPGEDYISVLSKNHERSDYCLSCFPGPKDLPGDTLGFWKATIPEKIERPTTKNERAMQLLHEALSEKKENLAFVLALYLARKKVLKLRQELKDSFLYEVLETEEMLQIEKVDLSSLEVEEIQQNIANTLSDAPTSS